MKISKQQLKQIIKEEYNALLDEENIEEISFAGLKGALGSGVRGIADIGKAVSDKAGEAAKSVSKAYTAGVKSDEERAAAKSKEQAKVAVLKKAGQIRDMISKLETKDLEELYDAAYPLSYVKGKGAGAMHANLESIRTAADNLGKRLETVVSDIESGKLAEGEELEESFFDFFKSRKEKAAPPPEPEMEPSQMDLFPGQGYGGEMSNAQVSKSAQDIILSANISTEKKAKMLHDLAKKAKDASLGSRIQQSAMYLKDSDPRELAQAVKIFERKIR